MVGGRNPSFNYARNQTYVSHGYPAAPPFNGQRLYTCTSPLIYDDTSANPPTMGIDCNMTLLFSMAQARAAADVGAAFDRWLGHGKPGAVRSDWPELAEATAWIVAAGGKAVIAHPMRYPLSAGALRQMWAGFLPRGGRAGGVGLAGARSPGFPRREQICRLRAAGRPQGREDGDALASLGPD